MNKKSMGKKTAVIVLAILIVAAIFLGLVLVNKGDGPVAGMILSSKVIENTQNYSESAKTHGDGVCLIVSNAFNKFQEDYKAVIPESHDLYATVHFVECPKGSEFTAKWMKNGNSLKEEKAALSTGQEGVISYMLDGVNVVKGSYTFELYDGDKKIFEKVFTIE